MGLLQTNAKRHLVRTATMVVDKGCVPQPKGKSMLLISGAPVALLCISGKSQVRVSSPAMRYQAESTSL